MERKAYAPRSGSPQRYMHTPGPPGLTHTGLTLIKFWVTDVGHQRTIEYLIGSLITITPSTLTLST